MQLDLSITMLIVCNAKSTINWLILQCTPMWIYHVTGWHCIRYHIPAAGSIQVRGPYNNYMLTFKNVNKDIATTLSRTRVQGGHAPPLPLLCSTPVHTNQMFEFALIIIAWVIQSLTVLGSMVVGQIFEQAVTVKAVAFLFFDCKCCYSITTCTHFESMTTYFAMICYMKPWFRTVLL